MPKVRRTTERKFFNGLRKAFQSLVDRIKQGGGSMKNGLSEEVFQFMNSGQMNDYLNRLVENMVKDMRVDSAAGWKQAAAKGSRGRYIHNLIKHEMQGPVGNRVWELISENVRYIQTVPRDWSRYIVEYAYREALKGRRPEDVEAELRQIMPEHITKNLKCIARTECAKANAAIVQARAEMCDIPCYFWRSVSDERTRDSHAEMDGVLVFYDDPPSPEALHGDRSYGRYHAGNTFNCRCYQEPVVDVRFLPDVVRVHDHGKIVTMNKALLLRKRYHVG